MFVYNLIQDIYNIIYILLLESMAIKAIMCLFNYGVNN